MKVDKEKTVSFDIDAQNGFTFNCPGELPVNGGVDIIDEINKNATKSRLRYASKDAHPSNGVWTADKENPQFSHVGLPNVDIRWNQHCVVGTFGFELIKGLPEMHKYDFFIYKGVERNLHPYSPIFHDLEKRISTGIIEKAKSDNVNTFILGGLALNYCLGEGAIDLKNAGFRVIVNLGATRGIGDIFELNKYVEKLKKLGIEIVNTADDIEIE
jgi:nicotinamidase/pyrazinamidase